jgi:hypothetical protein
MNCFTVLNSTVTAYGLFAVKGRQLLRHTRQTCSLNKEHDVIMLYTSHRVCASSPDQDSKATPGHSHSDFLRQAGSTYKVTIVSERNRQAYQDQ